MKLWFLCTLGRELSQMHKNEVGKPWLQKELIVVGFWISQVQWIGFFFFALVAKFVNK